MNVRPTAQMFEAAFAKIAAAPHMISDGDVAMFKEFGSSGLAERAIAARTKALAPPPPAPQSQWPIAPDVLAHCVIEVIEMAVNTLRDRQDQKMAALEQRILELEAQNAARTVPADAAVISEKSHTAHAHTAANRVVERTGEPAPFHFR